MVIPLSFPYSHSPKSRSEFRNCEKQNGERNLANILTEVEKLHLTIVNTGVLPLGSSTVDITIVA
ncbi:hypothetical protein PanWU01x14_235860 [Parasponia andersonii]|uniref:Uncharacterized protein n=1 Tax=Parasponia andersonii TaxID=3476 RepID=A0A2P5BIT8_PARAD|nr:hypothetical protein PanWU01x14_235860 [Parasponia andersonii]